MSNIFSNKSTYKQINNWPQEDHTREQFTTETKALEIKEIQEQLDEINTSINKLKTLDRNNKTK
jgi:hypothetical protein